MNNYGNFVPKNQFSSYFNPTQVQGTTTNNIIWVQGMQITFGNPQKDAGMH